jgi:hypothetical protein
MKESKRLDGKRSEKKTSVLPAMEFTGGFRPNWELPAAPAMAGLFAAHGGL